MVKVKMNQKKKKKKTYLTIQTLHFTGAQFSFLYPYRCCTALTSRGILQIALFLAMNIILMALHCHDYQSSTGLIYCYIQTGPCTAQFQDNAHLYKISGLALPQKQANTYQPFITLANAIGKHQHLRKAKIMYFTKKKME